MHTEQQQILRDRVIDLAADAKYRPYVIGYLLSCLDERHWEALVQSALEFGEQVQQLQAEFKGRIEGMPDKRG